jgi:hypothetical protein
MTTTSDMGRVNTRRAGSLRHNPFATRFTRPGRLPPRNEAGDPLDSAALLDRLVAEGGSAGLEGPHGSGKTTLLFAIAAAAATAGRLGGIVRLQNRGDAVAVVRMAARAAPRTIVCVDSWERMGPIASAVARWTAWRRGCGLLVTSHRRTGLPVLMECRTTVSLLRRLVRALPDHGGLITDADIATAHAAHGGDIREALLELYDRFERRAR